MPKTDFVSLRPSATMQRQLAELIATGHGNQTAVIHAAVERMWRAECDAAEPPRVVGAVEVLSKIAACLDCNTPIGVDAGDGLTAGAYAILHDDGSVRGPLCAACADKATNHYVE
mgnify:FL=1